MKRGRKSTTVWARCRPCRGTGRQAPMGHPLGSMSLPCSWCKGAGGDIKRRQLFLCLGGPLAGTQVTEREAGSEYTRFNSTVRGRCILVHEDELPK